MSHLREATTICKHLVHVSHHYSGNSFRSSGQGHRATLRASNAMLCLTTLYITSLVRRWITFAYKPDASWWVKRSEKKPSIQANISSSLIKHPKNNETSESRVSFHDTWLPPSALSPPVRGNTAAPGDSTHTKHHHKASQAMNSSWLTFTTASPDASVTSVNKQDRYFSYSMKRAPEWSRSREPRKQGRGDWLRSEWSEMESKGTSLIGLRQGCTGCTTSSSCFSPGSECLSYGYSRMRQVTRAALTWPVFQAFWRRLRYGRHVNIHEIGTWCGVEVRACAFYRWMFVLRELCGS